jgi:chemotaxis protein MotB
MIVKPLKSILVIFVVSIFAGCSFIVQEGRRSDVQKIEELSQKVDELSQAQNILEDRLSQEIKDKQVKLKMAEKGLVITFVADVLFDSGKAQLKQETFSSLDKVARVLNENVADLKVGIEGHTDNEPIKFSGWKSNWELSTGRALSVLHYLVDHEKVSPERLSVLGYGEYQPVAGNNTKEGKELNRRVEVVIFPKLTKVSPAQETETQGQENEVQPQEKIK